MALVFISSVFVSILSSAAASASREDILYGFASLGEDGNSERISLAEDPSPEQEEEDEYASFVISGAKLTKSAPRLGAAAPARAPLEASIQTEEGASSGGAADSWEARYYAGVKDSKFITSSQECDVGAWVTDKDASGAGVPQRMYRAEELMLAGGEAPTQAKRQEKMGERALRMYYHAKWLADRDHASAAEWRYREAVRLAKLSRRSALAAHALSWLGFFLNSWGRPEEALSAFTESEELKPEDNPLALYFGGLLARRTAGSNVEKIRAAEERILNAGKQPSEELEEDRQRLVREIRYWRAAESSPTRCFDAEDAAQAVVCFSSHVMGALSR